MNRQHRDAEGRGGEGSAPNRSGAGLGRRHGAHPRGRPCPKNALSSPSPGRPWPDAPPCSSRMPPSASTPPTPACKGRGHRDGHGLSFQRHAMSALAVTSGCHFSPKKEVMRRTRTSQHAEERHQLRCAAPFTITNEPMLDAPTTQHDRLAAAADPAHHEAWAYIHAAYARPIARLIGRAHV